MASIKVTFTVDVETVARLRTAAERLRIPQSQVVREAIAEYGARVGRLSETERTAMLKAFDRLVPAAAARSGAAVDAELRQLRAARRQSGRRTRSR
jgi:predicted transcriptional regulator